VKPEASIAAPADIEKINFDLKPVPPPGKGFQPSPGAPSNCTNWYASRDNDECASTATTFSVLATDFLAWNPYVTFLDALYGLFTNHLLSIIGPLTVLRLANSNPALLTALELLGKVLS
jgi:hypothetical protein